jgi:hypothetical protein
MSKHSVRYAGITGSPDESGSRRREKGLTKWSRWLIAGLIPGVERQPKKKMNPAR